MRHDPAGSLPATIPYHWTQVHNILRDPFETSRSGQTRRPALAWAAPSPRRVTAYIYDWNMLPIGQILWLKELESYVEFPPLQDAGELQPAVRSWSR